MRARSSRKPMSARNWMGVLRYSSMIRWNSTRLPPAWVCTGTSSSRAASLQARSRGSLHVSTWEGLSMPRSRHCLGRGRGHLAFERRGEAHVVRRPVVVLRHVEKEVVAGVARRVDVGIDEARGDELAPRREAGVGGPHVRSARMHDTVALEDDATLLVDLVALAVERDYPPAFDERSHDSTSSPLRAS